MTSPDTVRVAVVQHNAGTDVEKNLNHSDTLTRQAVADGAQLVTWAEAFAYLGRHEGKQDILELLPQGGPILKRCQVGARTAMRAMSLPRGRANETQLLQH